MKTSKRIDKKDVRNVIVDGLTVKIIGHSGETLDQDECDCEFEAKFSIDDIEAQLKNDSDFVDFKIFVSDGDEEFTKDQLEKLDEISFELE